MMTDGRPQTYEREKIHWNTAWLKTHGHLFEVVVNPDEALRFRLSKGKEPDLVECLRSEHVFHNAKQGQHASPESLMDAFQTEDQLAIARKLIIEGELQLSAEHRERIMEEKRNRMLQTIQQYAVDPTTGNPHPRMRIELAVEEAKVKFDYAKDAESQLADIVKQLQPIIPIRLEVVTLQVHLPSQFGQKLYGELERWGTLKRSDWLDDGALIAWVELPAGLQNDMIEDISKRTHGGADIKKVEGRAYTR